MTDNIEYLIESISECVEQDGADFDFVRDYQMLSSYLVPELIEEADISPNKLRVNQHTIKKELAEVLAELESSDDLVEVFSEKISQIESELKEKEVTEYTIAFPLNTIKNEYLDDEMYMNGIKFENISADMWKKEYVPAYEEHADRSHVLSVLWNYIHQLPIEIDDPSFSYWKASYYAREPGHAVSRLENSLLLLLGKLNFELYHSEPFQSRPDPWPPRYSNLVLPYIYFKWGDFFNGFRIGQIEGCMLPAERQSNASDNTDDPGLPSFDTRENLDPRIKSALKAYQSGLTSPDPQKSFFDFWRGIESLASFSDDDSSVEIANRCRTFINIEKEESKKILVQRLFNKRNLYTHEFAESSITTYDRDLVKLCLEKAIKQASQKRTEWTVDDWKFYLDNVPSEKNSLRIKRQNRERELELLQFILKENDTDQPDR